MLHITEGNNTIKLGIRIYLTQETNDMTHNLFEIFNINEISKEILNAIKQNVINFAKTLGV